MGRVRSFIAVVTLLVAGAPAHAQTTGRIAGTVTDQSGAVIARAEVRVVDAAAGTERTVVSDAGGTYLVPVLPPGTFQVSVAAPGFRRRTVEDVRVEVTETTRVDVSLEIGSVSEFVSVSARSDVLRVDGPQLGRVVNARGVAELPLATRNFTQILSLSPGTATYLPDSTGLGRNTQAISVNGARVTQNNYQLNGVDANGLGTNGPILVPVPAPETIEEFKVQTSLYDAAYGRAGGANIQVVTRSGTNDWHGAGYEYLRSDALNANDPFLNAAHVERPVLRRNVFGATLGGPVRRNRAFFFASYQGTRETNGASITNSISSGVLIAPGLTDDRSAATLLATFHPVLPDGAPAAAIDPAALALLNARLPNETWLMPTPDTEGRFTASTPSSFRETQFNLNLDYNAGPKDTFWVKTFVSSTAQTPALPSFKGTGPNVPGFATDGTFGNRLIAFQHTHTFSSALVNEARAGYTINSNSTVSREPIADDQVGIARSTATGYPGLPLIRIAQAAGGIAIGTAAQAQFLGTPTTSTLNDTVSFVRGRHTARAGGEFRYNVIDFDNPVLVRGQIDFANFSDFLVGKPQRTTVGNGIARGNLRALDYNLFVQDDWRLLPRLTLNAGVRYELDMPVYDANRRLSTFDPALYRPRLALTSAGVPLGPPEGGVVQAASAHDSLIRAADTRNLAPRLGFAASIAEGLVLRGGYGLYHSRPTFQYASATTTLPPFYVLGIQTAPRTLSDPFFRLPSSAEFPTFVPGVALAGTAFDRELHVPYFHQFNVTSETRIAGGWTIEAGYVGSRGSRLFRQEAINQANLASDVAPIANAVTGALITTNTDQNAALRAPFQGVSTNGFFLIKSTGESRYDSLQVSLIGHVSDTLQLLGSYTLARSVDDASGVGGGAGVSGLVNPSQLGDSSGVLGDQRDRSANRGVSDFNHTHRLVISSVWDLPAPAVLQRSPIAQRLFSGWNLSGILTLMSGLPIDIVDTGAGSLYGLANGGVPLARPDFAPGFSCVNAKEGAPAGYFFNPFAFTSPVVAPGDPIPSSSGSATASARGTDIGNVPRNCLVGPRQANVDVAAVKNIPLGASRRLQLRAEFFNLFNHPNLANPISNLDAVAPSGGRIDPGTGRILSPGNFGRIISSSANPRLVQLAVRMLF
jgi:hypothetical protein